MTSDINLSLDELKRQVAELSSQLAAERNGKIEALKMVESLEQQVFAKSAALDHQREEAQMLLQRIVTLEEDKRLYVEEEELNVLYSQQVQDELDSYFLLARNQSDMLSSVTTLNSRMADLLFRFRL